MNEKILKIKNKIVKILYNGLSKGDDTGGKIYQIIQELIDNFDDESKKIIFKLVLTDFKIGYEKGDYLIEELEILYNNLDFPNLMMDLGFCEEGAEWYQFIYDLLDGQQPHYLIWKSKCLILMGKYKEAFNELLNCFEEVVYVYNEDGNIPYPEFIKENKKLLLKIFQDLLSLRNLSKDNEFQKKMMNSLDSIGSRLNIIDKKVDKSEMGEQINILPQKEETNFQKSQKFVFNNLKEFVFIVDPYLRYIGLDNLFEHLRNLKSRKIKKLKILTTKTAFVNFNNNCVEGYKNKIKRISRELKIIVIVKCINNQEIENSIHNRYAHTIDRSWDIPPLNKIHKFDSTINELSEITRKEKNKLHEKWFIESLDLIKDFEKINLIVDNYLKKRKSP